MKRYVTTTTLLSGLCLGLLVDIASGQDVTYTLSGAHPGTDLGRMILGPGDLDDDGFGDFVTLLNHLNELQARSGVDGQVLWSRDISDFAGGGFVTSSADVTGDLDGDGVADLVLGSKGTWSTAVNAGRVRVFSGADGSEIWTQVGEASNLFFGTSVAGIDDVDGDGLEDVAVGAWSDEPDPPVQGNVGSVRVLSGADGSELYRFYGPAFASSGPGGCGMGGTLGRLGDLDHDGVGDFGVGAFLPFGTTDGGDNVPSPVWIVSGVDGTVLKELPTPAYVGTFRPIFADPGDLTGDGVAEVVVGCASSQNPGSGSNGVALLFEGGTWNVLAEWQADAPHEYFGGALAVPGDVDDDGYSDILVGVRFPIGSPNSHPGVVRLYSGQTHEELFELFPPPATHSSYYDFFGRSLAALGDLNGDGAPEFAVGTAWTDGVGGPGRVEVRSTLPLTLYAQAPFVSAEGGVQRLRISLGSDHAGELHVVLGSATGIAPPIVLDGLPLPLLPDAYTTWLLSSSGGTIGPGFVGQLDSQGQASVKVDVPPLVGLLAGLVGETYWHAALAIGPAGAVTATTNAAPLVLLP